jgi:hypothetical protein
MSDFPPPDRDPYLAPRSPIDAGPPRSNGAALASLICGILICIPLVSGPISILLGIIGLSKTRDPRVGGKGLAIAGIVLGLAGMCIQIPIGYFAFIGARAGMQVVLTPQEFLKDLSTGNVDGAMAKCAPTVQRSTIEESVAQVKEFGPFQTFQLTGSQNDATGSATLRGNAVFQSGTKDVTFRMTMDQKTFKFQITDWSIK